jgi:HD-GYP domain-containing protein (c-di-GMP phosphodiesterase class II)
VVNVRRLPISDRLINGAMYAMAGFAAGLGYASISRWTESPTSGVRFSLIARRIGLPASTTLSHLILPFAVAAAVHVLVNYGVLRQRLLLDRRRRQARSQASSELAMLPLLASDLGLSVFGPFVATLWAVLGAFAIALVLVPLCVARWAIGQLAEQHGARAGTLAALCRAVETKDLYTRSHGDRVSRGAALIARELRIGAARTEAVTIAGLLHDVGKVSVPTRVLQKDGPMTEEEAAAIQLHPMAGLKIVGEIAFLREALSGITHHHERMDGGGYPMGLAGHEIPEFARIIAVADAFDAMTSNRSYRSGLNTGEALFELRRCAGSQFDPVMVEAFIAAISGSGPAATTG